MKVKQKDLHACYVDSGERIYGAEGPCPLQKESGTVIIFGCSPRVVFCDGH